MYHLDILFVNIHSWRKEVLVLLLNLNIWNDTNQKCKLLFFRGKKKLITLYCYIKKIIHLCLTKHCVQQILQYTVFYNNCIISHVQVKLNRKVLHHFAIINEKLIKNRSIHININTRQEEIAHYYTVTENNT